ncbi:M48 family metallopeptidase [Dysgonomonas sp. BGC7]|uniref:M48 family metallopeptidase n=1 Tax=Dysgonomonas sp. BGC7 TaxID=1658008 RepID=UPI0006807C7E|nr:M48 family metallopeptidase [Dysgonomonas sp. BGC7]MBD8389827.1 M48 family metallopeptidase [Dysgonomonas sp. BGC7]
MIIKVENLGEIKLLSNPRARKIIVRKKQEYLQLTHPSSMTEDYIRRAIEEMKPRLLKLLQQSSAKLLLTPETTFKTFSFELKIIESSTTNNYYLKLKDGLLTISCPVNTQYDAPSVQKTLREMVDKTLRYEANRLFPSKIDKLSALYNFSYSTLTINKSRTRWGSCSSKQSINLSYYCMLLPEYLVDFVILHELCHTREMNHGERFWKLLDSVTSGKAKELTKELRAYKTNW